MRLATSLSNNDQDYAMTYPPPYPGAPQGQGNSSGSPYDPYAMYGRHPANTPYSETPYGQAPTPTDQASYTSPDQLATPPQSAYSAPGGAAFPGQVQPPAQVPVPQYLTGPAGAPQYQPYQQYQPYAESGPPYLSGAATAPGYPPGGHLPQVGHPGAGTTAPQTIGAGHHVPWRGEKTAVLIMMLLACALEFILYITFILELTRGDNWLNLILTTIIFIFASPLIWWLYFGLRHLFRNQPVSEMVGLSLWFSYGVLGLLSGSSDDNPHADVANVVIVLFFIVTTTGAVLTVRLNQQLRNPRHWTVTVAQGACQFVLLNNTLRLAELGVFVSTAALEGKSTSQYASSAWLMWSSSGGAGLPLVPGLIIWVAITSLATAGVFLGTRSPHRRAFHITSVSAVSLLTLYNLIIVLAYGLPTSGEHAHNPSDMGMEVLTIALVGIILIGLTLLAGCRHASATPTSSSPHDPYSSDRPGTSSTQSRFRQYRQQPQSPTRGGY